MAKKLNRNLVGVLTLVGMVLLAVAGFALLQSLPGQDPKTYEEEAKKHEEKGEYELAARTYSRAYSRDPDKNPEYLVKAARCALQEGSLNGAREILGAARVRDQKLASAAQLATELEYEVAKLFPSSFQWNHVLTEAKKLAAITPQSPLALLAMGQAYLSLVSEDATNRDKGEEALKKALEIDPANADVVEQLTRLHWSEAYEKKNKGQKAEGDAMEAAANSLLTSAIEKAKAGPADKLAQLQRLQASYYFITTTPEKGIAELEKLSGEEKSGSVDSHLLLATVYAGWFPGARKQDYERAEQVYREALKIDPKNGIAYRGLGQVYKSLWDKERDPEKRKATIEKEKQAYRDGLANIPRTKHFRDLRNNAARIYFMTELFLLDADAAEYTREPKAKSEAIASAETWISKLKEEVDANSLDTRFMTATLLNVKGDYVSATKEAEAANRMQDASRHVRLQALLGELYSRQRQWGSARKALESAIQIRPDAPNLRTRLAEVYLYMNEPTLALLQLKPGQPGPMRDFLAKDENANRLLVEAYRQLGQVDQAQSIMNSLTEGPGRSELQAARLLMTELKFNEAETKLKAILAKEPNNTDAIRALFRTYRLAGRDDDAQAFVKALLERDPKNAGFRDFQLTLLQSKPGNEEVVRKFLEGDPDPFNRSILLADHFAGQEKYEEAMKHLDEAEKTRPNGPAVLDRQLRVALMAKSWDRAAKYVAKDGELNADGTEGKVAEGRMAFAKQDYLRAVELIRVGLEKYPNYSMGWTYLGEAYLSMPAARVSDARNAFLRALEIDPTNGFANRGLADIFFRENDEKSAEKYLLAASRALPGDKWVQRRMQISKEKESPQSGIAEREKRRKENPKDLENLVYLARLYAEPKVAQFDKAAEVYKEALAIAEGEGRLSLAREIARFYGREDVGRPVEGDALLMGMMNTESDKPKKAQIAIALGQFYEFQKSLATADRYYRLAVSMDPSSAVLRAAGEFYARTNRYRDSAEYYQRLLAQCGNDTALCQETHSRIIALWLAIGDLDAAKKDIDTYVAKYPNDAQGMIYQGAYHRLGGDIQKAKEAFDAHLEKDPNHPVALWQRGQMFMLMGKWQPAIEDLRKAKSFSPDGFFYQHRIALADSLLETGHGDEAVAELRSILEKKPDETTVAEALVDAYTRVRPPRYGDAEELVFTYLRRFPKDYKWPMLLGAVGERAQKLDKAVEGYEKAAELARERPEVVTALFNAYKAANKPQSIIDYVSEKMSNRQLSTMPMQLALLGWAYHKAGNSAKSEEAYDRALGAASEDIASYTQIVGQMVTTLGPKEVLARAKTQASADPENIEKQKALVHLLQQNGEAEAALAAAKKVAELAVRDVDTIFGQLAQGMLLEQLGKPDEARAKYEAVLKTDPKQPVALNNLAYLLAEIQGRPAEALPYAQQASRLDQNNPDVLDTLGWIQALNKKYGDAVGTLLRALEGDRNNTAALYHLGMVHVWRQEPGEAKDRLEKAKKLAEEKGDKRFLPKITEALKELGT